MRSSLVVLVLCATAWGDTAVPPDSRPVDSAPQKSGDSGIPLPGWKRPVRFGMSMDDIRRVASPRAESTRRQCSPKSCLIYDDESGSIPYSIELSFTDKKLVAISISCEGTEACGESLRDYWKTQTGSLSKRRTVRRGAIWEHELSVSDDSGDAAEWFSMAR
jgi:hypothetical protein